MTHRDALPQLADQVFLTDGGIETTLIFDDGLDLPDFAAFTLLHDPRGREALVRYFDTYAALAAEVGAGIVLETPTWRASSDWGDRLGYTADELHDANAEAVALVRAAGAASGAGPVVVSGCVGPRGDGYVADDRRPAAEAQAYHRAQIEALAAGGADMVGAITMTHVEEAVGVARSAEAAGIPVAISFTSETDGRLPSGDTLADAIIATDAATGGYPAYYMVNCAHPTHFADALDPAAAWTQRVRGIRANASRLGHAELDAAEELDRGDPHDLAGRYAALREVHPQITVLGGCCGTDHHHVGAIGRACVTTVGV